MALQDTGRPLTDLVGSLVNDISDLFRKEIQLAKTEASEKLDDAMKAGRNVAIGAVLAIGAIGVLLAAFVSGLTALLVAFGFPEVPAYFVAAVVVAVIIGIIAWAMISRGMSEFNTNKLNMDRTAKSIRMDANTVRETI